MDVNAEATAGDGSTGDDATAGGSGATRWTVPAIDRRFFEVRPALFYRDLIVPGAAFAIAYASLLQAQGWAFAAAFLIAVVSLHRAAILMHDICHQYDNPRLKRFIWVWDLTIGAIAAIPSPRFLRPHRIHHATGTFRTKDDPQYLLVRTDRTLAVFVLILIPFIMPVLNLANAVVASVAGTALDEAVERWAAKRGMPTGSVVADRHRPRVIWLSRYCVALYALYAYLLPETLGIAYAVLVAGWWLTTIRIPLEHRMEHLLERSDKRDHILDSFTIESPLAAILQPLAMRFHAAHHLYPGVPYHNLPALHRDLKASDGEYRATIVPFWSVVRGNIPERPRATA